MRPIVSTICSLVFAVTAATAQAQTCRGSASLDHAPLQLGADLTFASSARAVGASFTGGHDSVFGFAHVGYETLTTLNIGAPTVGGGFGGQFPTAGRAHVCSLVDLTYLSGPKYGTTDTRSLVTTAGGQVGIEAYIGPSLRVVPTVGAAFQVLRLTSIPPFGANALTIEHYGLARFGVGFIVSQQLAVTPEITVPFALVGGETSFAVALTYNFK